MIEVMYSQFPPMLSNDNNGFCGTKLQGTGRWVGVMHLVLMVKVWVWGWGMHYANENPQKYSYTNVCLGVFVWPQLPATWHLEKFYTCLQQILVQTTSVPRRPAPTPPESTTYSLQPLLDSPSLHSLTACNMLLSSSKQPSKYLPAFGSELKQNMTISKQLLN